MLFYSQWIDLKHMLPWYRTKEQKNALRGILEQKRRILTAEQIARESEQVIARIEQMSHFQQAQTVMVYYPIHHELSLLPLVEKYKDQKTFLFPITHRKGIEVRPYEGEEKMKKGKFHIPEPQTAAYNGPIDLILIPGVGFDKHCNRLGRGGGYYDRFLSKQKKSFQIGVAYEFQLQQNELPHNRCDHRLNRVVTPTRTVGA